jgi:hypothetical protein
MKLPQNGANTGNEPNTLNSRVQGFLTSAKRNKCFWFFSGKERSVSKRKTEVEVVVVWEYNLIIYIKFGVHVTGTNIGNEPNTHPQ